MLRLTVAPSMLIVVALLVVCMLGQKLEKWPGCRRPGGMITSSGPASSCIAPSGPGRHHGWGDDDHDRWRRRGVQERARGPARCRRPRAQPRATRAATCTAGHHHAGHYDHDRGV
jgi:hypothetical protein